MENVGLLTFIPASTSSPSHYTIGHLYQQNIPLAQEEIEPWFPSSTSQLVKIYVDGQSTCVTEKWRGMTIAGDERNFKRVKSIVVDRIKYYCDEQQPSCWPMERHNGRNTSLLQSTSYDINLNSILWLILIFYTFEYLFIITTQRLNIFFSW